MKQNLILTAILAILISFAYFWEQKEGKKILSINSTDELLFDFDKKSIVELTLKKSKLIKDKDKWVIGELNYQVDTQKLNFILNTLEGISIVKRFESSVDTKEFFAYQDHAFRIKTYEKEIGFRLGDISSVTGYFYLEKFDLGKKELFLVKDTNAYDGIYKDDVEAEFRKYLAFKNIITMEPMDLISRKLIPDLSLATVNKVKVDNKANRWFEIDFEKQTTIPAIYPGLKYKQLMKVFSNAWQKVQVDKFIKKDKNILAEVVSTVLIHSENKETKVQIFGKFNEVSGLYAMIDDKDYVYVLNESSKSFFFSNVQNFWLKRIDYKVDFSKIKKFNFSIGDMNKFYQFKVDDVEAFEVVIDDSRVKMIKTQNMNMLFNLILNLVEFKEAKYVTQNLTKKLKGTFIRLNIFQKKLKIVFSQNSITVQNLSDKLEYFYPHNISSIKINNLSDFFTLN